MRRGRSWLPLLRRGYAGLGELLLLSGLGTGLSPLAPGTAGTLLALGAVLALPAPAWVWSAAGLGLFLVGVPLVDRCEDRIGDHDPGWIVIDEIAAYWMLVGTAAVEGLERLTLLFLLFRVVDVAKPWPLRRLDRELGGGLGVMVDDLLGAVYVVVTWQLLVATGFVAG